MSCKGLLIVLSGPAGSGKGTVASLLSGERDDLFLSVSVTSRPVRGNEREGVEYHFITREAFEENIKNGMMLEYTEYCGNYYGTPKAKIDENLDRGVDVLLEIEVDGASQIKKTYPDCVSVMLLPPDVQTLEKRLRARGTENEASIQRRLERARAEVRMTGEYDYVVFNPDGGIARCADEISAIITAEKRRAARNLPEALKYF